MQRLLYFSVFFILRDLRHLIVVVNKYNCRSVFFCLVRRHIAVCHNNNFITLLNTPCRRTVKAYNARIFFSGYCTRLKALTVVYVNYLHLFIFKYTGCFQKCRINRYTSDIIKFCLCNDCTMYFTFKHC